MLSLLWEGALTSKKSKPRFQVDVSTHFSKCLSLLLQLRGQNMKFITVFRIESHECSISWDVYCVGCIFPSKSSSNVWNIQKNLEWMLLKFNRYKNHLSISLNELRYELTNITAKWTYHWKLDGSIWGSWS